MAENGGKKGEHEKTVGMAGGYAEGCNIAGSNIGSMTTGGEKRDSKLTVEDIGKIMKDLEFSEEVIDIFMKNKVNGRLCQDLNEDFMKDLGIQDPIVKRKLLALGKDVKNGKYEK